MNTTFAAVTSGAAAVAVLLLARRRRRRAQAAAAEQPEAAAAAEPTWEQHTCRMPKRLPKSEAERLRQQTSLHDREAYFGMSTCPITEDGEQKMEQVSTVVSRENYNDHWEAGVYACARCGNLLYNGGGKFVGPCMWPSFRKAHHTTSLHTITVPRGSYNKYECDVAELYCQSCHLFLGHQFEDGRTCGDTHPEARWRHCVLSLSLSFIPN